MARIGLESLALGTPVIATAESGLSGWLSRGCGLTIAHPESALEMGHAMEQVSAHWKDLNEAAIAVARSWTWRDHAHALVGAFESSGVHL
jgi:glycosyltransferase involved in cell wall biosynthesis